MIESAKRHGLVGCAAALLLVMAACAPQPAEEEASPEETATSEAATPIVISPDFPSDIPGGAQSADLENAATFAWQEFISLNWPAVPQTGTVGSNSRDTPDPSKLFGDPSYDGPLAWETYRGKVEIYPGNGQNPNGYVDDASVSYGYDALPQYFYDPTKVGTQDGQVAACNSNQSGDSVPWVNLDEINEIGQNEMFAGVAPSSPVPGQQILFLAKAGRNEYDYVAANGWFPPAQAPTTQTAAFIQQNKASPPAGSSQYVSFLNGTVELKAAWRLLNSGEDASRFHTTTVRYYETNTSTGYPCYVDGTMALVALHIIHKTPTAPYFIFATFGQADNILTTSGEPVEDADGNIINNPGADPFDPNITSKNATSADPATAQSIQALSPATAACQPGERLYFVNTPSFATTQGTICVNKRAHDIPQTIIDVNQSAHDAITSYNQANNIASSPWLYYKLVNVQWQPINKPTPGVTYTGSDAATYYQANIVVETNYNLQFFSGQFQPALSDPSVNVKGLITDFNLDGTDFYNTFYSGNEFNMGGCMGCHGNAQVGGTDFSFIFNFPVTEPEAAGDTSNADSVSIEKYHRIVRSAQVAREVGTTP